VVRIRRVDGQINGIEKMISGERPCMDIVNQIDSARAALEGLRTVLISEHLQSCVLQAKGESCCEGLSDAERVAEIRRTIDRCVN